MENQNKMIAKELLEEYVKIKRVNHGNVFNTGSWFTFYCEGCGMQVINKSEKCE